MTREIALRIADNLLLSTGPLTLREKIACALEQVEIDTREKTARECLEIADAHPRLACNSIGSRIREKFEVPF